MTKTIRAIFVSLIVILSLGLVMAKRQTAALEGKLQDTSVMSSPNDPNN